MKRALKDNQDAFAGQEFYIGIDELLGFRNHLKLRKNEALRKKVLSADKDLVGVESSFFYSVHTPQPTADCQLLTSWTRPKSSDKLGW
jgi:hypothetical protein